MKLSKDRVLKENPGVWYVSWRSLAGIDNRREFTIKTEAEKMVTGLINMGITPTVTYKYPVIEVTVKIE